METIDVIMTGFEWCVTHPELLTPDFAHRGARWAPCLCPRPHYQLHEIGEIIVPAATQVKGRECLRLFEVLGCREHTVQVSLRFIYPPLEAAT